MVFFTLRVYQAVHGACFYMKRFLELMDDAAGALLLSHCLAALPAGGQKCHFAEGKTFVEQKLRHRAV